MSVFDTVAPAEKWTDKFGLSHAPISLEDMITPEFYAREKEAIFRRTWLFVGRVNRVPKVGSYFTKEIEVLDTSVIVIRDKDERVRVYYNVCPHRGNKLLWNTYADQEVSGQCRRISCKLHGLAFGLDGKLELLTGGDTWLDNQGRQLKLAEVPSEVWNGFIFVNLTKGGPTQSFADFIGSPLFAGLEGYAFDDMTQHYSCRLTAKSNWKAMNDGFSEIYHGATSHPDFFPMPDADPENPFTFLAAHFGIHGPHRQYVFDGHGPDPFIFPMEKETRATAVGPRLLGPKNYMKLPHALNPSGVENWGTSSLMIWPNIFIQWYAPGWFLTYAFWPLAHDQMRFELDYYLPKPNDFSELLSQKAGILMFCEATLQDFALLEAQQQGLAMRVFDSYPLTDEEVMVRAYHHQVADTVTEYESSLRGEALMHQR